MTSLTILAAAALLSGTTNPAPVVIPVTATPALGLTNSGRLIVFMKRLEPAKPGDKPEIAVDFSAFAPTGTTIAARDVAELKPGVVATVDGETDVFPAPMSALPAGTYRMQAVLDRNRDYAYGGRGGGDLISKVVTVTLPGKVPVLALDSIVPDFDVAAALAKLPAAHRERLAPWIPRVRPVEVPSAALTAFRGAPMQVRGWVALPPGYDGKQAFPTVYSTDGFGGSLTTINIRAANMMAMMAEKSAPPMIWVFLDHSGATGTNELADSANNGPWGRALTEEVMPALERQYRMDRRASGRFLTGHSSGGWATLWLQVRYPKLFGGTWPTSPDPSDFHDFTNVDLYAPNANFYAGVDGRPRPLIRDKGKVVASMRDYARAEAVLGAAGGQIASFEWVFSPRGVDGRPVPLFDRATGRIDPAVAAHWRDNYDIAHIIARDWRRLKPDLNGKIYLIVGTADNFYLDGSARRLQAVLDGLGARSSFRYFDGKTHFDLFARDKDRFALVKDIAWEMYAVARPGQRREASKGVE